MEVSSVVALSGLAWVRVTASVPCARGVGELFREICAGGVVLPLFLMFGTPLPLPLILPVVASLFARRAPLLSRLRVLRLLAVITRLLVRRAPLTFPLILPLVARRSLSHAMSGLPLLGFPLFNSDPLGALGTIAALEVFVCFVCFVCFAGSPSTGAATGFAATAFCSAASLISKSSPSSSSPPLPRTRAGPIVVADLSWSLVVVDERVAHVLRVLRGLAFDGGCDRVRRHELL